MRTKNCSEARAAGYTLIELMIAAAIIAMMAAIAIPAYRDYVTRGQLISATNALLQTRTSMEQYYQDNRTYITTGTTCGVTAPVVSYFTVACTGTATTYTITATGSSGNVSGFAYTIDQNGNQKTTSLKWGSTADTTGYNCWLIKKGQAC